jgi:EAL and modified HD-GYP domain-containing signal transduction protein
VNIFLARQPILDKKQKVLAYEIFYRSGFLNVYTGTDHDEATSKVIIDTFHNLGLDALTAGKPAFINFSAALLEQEVATLFPSDQLVVEVLECVRGSEEVLEKCRQLKAAGYTIALDDFVYNEDSEPFLDVADIVKIDLLVTDKAEIREVVKRLERRSVILLAEKVETYEAFREAADLGFTLFQGYFFSRPEMVTAKALAPLHITCFELIAEANKDELDLDLLTRIISRDVSLSYNLLRLVNSAAFVRRHPAKTVKDALVFLGQREIRKWVSLIALQRMCDTDLEAPVITSLVRGRFVELVAAKTRFKDVKGMLFLCGLFSLLDVLLQRPLLQILEEVGAPEETVELLVYKRGPFKELGSLMLAYEQGQWEAVEASSQKLNLPTCEVAQAYLDALEWCPRVGR